MVRQYDWNRTQSYTLFHYQSDGEIKELENLFVRRENIPEDSTQPCPYYEVNGKEVEQSEFEAQLQEKILDRLLQRDAWTALCSSFPFYKEKKRSVFVRRTGITF